MLGVVVFSFLSCCSLRYLFSKKGGTVWCLAAYKYVCTSYLPLLWINLYVFFFEKKGVIYFIRIVWFRNHFDCLLCFDNIFESRSILVILSIFSIFLELNSKLDCNIYMFGNLSVRYIRLSLTRASRVHMLPVHQVPSQVLKM